MKLKLNFRIAGLCSELQVAFKCRMGSLVQHESHKMWLELRVIFSPGASQGLEVEQNSRHQLGTISPDLNCRVLVPESSQAGYG